MQVTETEFLLKLCVQFGEKVSLPIETRVSHFLGEIGDGT